MADNNETTSKFKVDISELKKNFQEATRQIRLANSEFKAATSGMDNWGDSADGITAKLKQLNDVLDAEKTKLKSLEDQYELVAKEQGETSKGAEELRIKINNQKAAIGNTEKQIRNYTDKLEDIESGADKAGNELKDLSEKAKDSGDGFTVAKGAIANFIANGLTALAGAAKNAISSMAGLAESTREYREDMGKLETAFTTAGFTSEQATDVYKDFFAVLGEEDRSVEAVNHLAKLASSQEDLQKWTTIATGVWGTFGDSLPIEGLTEAANETAKVGKVTGPLADALNWAGVSEDKFNESLENCNSEQERQQLIMDTLNGLYTDAANKYNETNESVMEANRATSDFTDAQAALGEKIEPITTKVKQGFADVLGKILELVNGADFSKLEAAIDTGFSWLINTGLPAIKTGFQWVIDNKDILIAGIAGIAAAMATMNVANMIMGVVKAFKAFKAAQEGATVAQWLLNVAMNANPIGIIIALITGLVTAFVVLWKKSEAFRNFWIGLWENIKNVASTVLDAIKQFFSATWDAIKAVWDMVSPYFMAIWESIKAIFEPVIQWFTSLFSSVFETIKDIFNNVVGFLKGIWELIKLVFKPVADWFSDKFGAAWKGIKNVFSKVSNFFSEVWASIKKPFSSVATWFKDTFSKAWQAVKDVFSTGGKIFDGIKEGIASTFTTVVNGIIGGINKVISLPFKGINGALKKIKNIEILGVEPFKDKISLIDVPQIPLLATGTVATKATPAIIGEDGAEMVMPLEKHTRWIDILAGKIMSRMDFDRMNGFAMNPQPNVVNNNFYQTNNSPKALSRLEIYRQSKNLLKMKG